MMVVRVEVVGDEIGKKRVATIFVQIDCLTDRWPKLAKDVFPLSEQLYVLQTFLHASFDDGERPLTASEAEVVTTQNDQLVMSWNVVDWLVDATKRVNELAIAFHQVTVQLFV